MDIFVTVLIFVGISDPTCLKRLLYTKKGFKGGEEAGELKTAAVAFVVS